MFFEEGCDIPNCVAMLFNHRQNEVFMNNRGNRTTVLSSTVQRERDMNIYHRRPDAPSTRHYRRFKSSYRRVSANGVVRL